jgi:type 1 fimbria pilin
MFALIVMLAGAVIGQSTTATISGTIADEQQAVMPGATVTLRNVGTNVTRSATTDSDGGTGSSIWRSGSTS